MCEAETEDNCEVLSTSLDSGSVGDPICCRLIMNVSHGLVCLNTLSPPGGIAWKEYGTFRGWGFAVMTVVALVVAAVVMAGVVRFCSLAPVPILCSMCDSELETPHAGLLAYPKQQTITSTASANFLRSGCFGQSISFQRQKKEGGHCLKAMRCNPVEQDTQTGGQTDRWAGTHTHTHTHGWGIGFHVSD